MTEITIQDVRAKYPQYDDLSDTELADALHTKFYSDIPKEEFYSKIGLVQQSQPQEQGFGSAALETGGAIAQNMGAQSAAGLAGMFEFAKTGIMNTTADLLRSQGFNEAADFVQADATAADAANKVVEDTLYSLGTQSNQQGLSERSQAQMQDVGQFVEGATDVARQPLSGLAGLGELATGQGLDQASQTIQNVQQQGFGETVGSRVLEEGGSPELATAAYMSADLVPYGLAGKVASRGLNPLETAARNAPQTLPAAAQIVSEGAQDAAQIARAVIPRRAENIKTAEMRKGIQGGSKYFIDKKIDPKTGRIVDDKAAKKAQSQIISDETIAKTKSLALNSGSRKAAKEIVDKASEILEFPHRANEIGRPNQVIGNRIMKRFDTVLKANNKAGGDIGKTVKNMEGQSFDVSDVIDSWDDTLENLKIKKVDGKLDFKGSDIQGNQVASIIRMMDERLSTSYDAISLHKEKKFIANKLYNASGEAKVKGGSLDPNGVAALEKLRDGFNQKLRDASPEYASANDRYSETITVLNDFKKAMGQKQFNPYSDRIDNSIGQEVRKVLTNYRKGQDMSEAIANMDKMSKKYGGNYNDDIVGLTDFYNNLENEFQSFAPASYKADTRGAMKDTAGVVFDAATGAPVQTVKGAANLGSKLLKKDVTEQTRIKALKDLLRD